MSSGLAERSKRRVEQPARHEDVAAWRSRSLPTTAGGGFEPEPLDDVVGDRGCRLDAGKHEGEPTVAAGGRPAQTSVVAPAAASGLEHAASSIRFGDGETIAAAGRRRTERVRSPGRRRSRCPRS